MRGLGLSFRKVSGGGHAIDDVIRDTLTDHSPALCIVDSDMDSPNATALGQTAHDAQKSYNKYGHEKSCFVILNARELENLLPDLILEGVWPSETRLRTSIIRHLSRDDSGDLRLFIDIKRNGLRLANIFESLRGKVNYFSFVSDPSLFPSIKDDCRTITLCRLADACECSLLAPLGRSALDSSVELIQREKLTSLLDGLCDVHKKELHRVLQLIVDWGVAAPRVTA